MPTTYYETLDWACQITVDKNTVTFDLGNSALDRIKNKGKNIHAILEYTKTTD